MAYISYVIDELEAEVEEQTAQVVDFLPRPLPLASRASSLALTRQADVAQFGRSPQGQKAVWNIKPHLKFWDKLRWPFLGNDRQWEIARTTAKYQPLVDAYVHERDRLAQEHAARVAEYERRIAGHRREVQEHNERITALESKAAAGDAEASAEIAGSRLSAFFAVIPLVPDVGHNMALQGRSKRLLIELVLPPKSALPTEKSVRFLKTTGEHRYTHRSETELRRMYLSFVAQAVLATLNAAFSCFSPIAMVKPRDVV